MVVKTCGGIIKVILLMLLFRSIIDNYALFLSRVKY